jgi:putative transposase
MHCLWTLPAGDAGFALRWQAIKFVFSRRLPKHESRSPTLAARRERGIWQQRYWEHLIRDDADYQRHFDYIHFNPFKHGHVTRVSDWPFSSVHRAVRTGIYCKDWSGGEHAESAGQSLRELTSVQP